MNTCHSHRRVPLRLGALITAFALVLTLGSASLAGTAAAAPPTSDPATAAGYAGRWLAGRVNADGFVPDDMGDPAPADTVATAVSLAAAGAEQETFNRVVNWLEANVDTVTGTGVNADPGQIGYLMMVVVVSGHDVTNFGGVNLVTRLNATLGAFEPGLYGSYASVGDPTYSGVFTQSLAILGLAAAGVSQSSAALDWLAAQQCGGADEFNGAWMSYRPHTDPSDPTSPLVACTPFDSSLFTGIDTNSTSIAYEAMVAAGRTPGFDALAWLNRTENADGSFGFFVGNDGDPDSDALVIQAIVAGGESPTAGRWALAGGDPMTSLLSFQLGCDQPASDQGAFTFSGSGGATNALATEQATWGAAQAPFPLDSVEFTATPVPCQIVPPTTTPTTGSGSAGVEPATAVEATPALTG